MNKYMPDPRLDLLGSFEDVSGGFIENSVIEKERNDCIKKKC